jgi:hypothetical protein
MNVTGMYGDNGEIWMNVALKKRSKNHDLRQTIFYSNRDDNNGT